MSKLQMDPAQKRIALILLSLIVTFVILRIYLHNYPGTNLDIGKYNIHHLFTGLLIITVFGLPLILFRNAGRMLDVVAVIFGSGLSMALDEWVYLIATDGSDRAYLLPVSLWGASVVIGTTVIYGIFLLWLARKNT